MTAVVERPKYLSELLSEVDLMDESLFPPHHKQEPGDKVIGTVSGWPRKVFALAMMYSREAERLTVEMKYAEDRDSLNQQFIRSQMNKDLLLDIFWNCCRIQFDYFGYTCIGIRADWLFVASQDPMAQLINHLGIGG